MLLVLVQLAVPVPERRLQQELYRTALPAVPVACEAVGTAPKMSPSEHGNDTKPQLGPPLSGATGDALKVLSAIFRVRARAAQGVTHVLLHMRASVELPHSCASRSPTCSERTKRTSACTRQAGSRKRMSRVHHTSADVRVRARTAAPWLSGQVDGGDELQATPQKP